MDKYLIIFALIYFGYFLRIMSFDFEYIGNVVEIVGIFSIILLIVRSAKNKLFKKRGLTD